MFPACEGDAGTETKGGSGWQRITVYVLERLAGAYGTVRMPESRGYGIARRFRSIAAFRRYTDLRKFLDTSVPSISSHGSPAGTIYRAGKAGAQAMAQSERIKASSAANRFQAVSHASMMSPRLGNTELASQWLRR